MKKISPRFHARAKILARTRKAHRAAFTLVEMLVVIGITMLLSSIAIGYSKIGQNEVALTVETSKVAELILQAKELSINTYGLTESGAKACAFGVHFDVAAQTYSLFAYTSSAARCPSIASTTASTFSYADPGTVQAYQPGSWNIPIAQGVQMDSADFSDVLFYPPVPITLINPNAGDQFAPAPVVSTIHLSTTDGRNSSVITINHEGQVSF